MQMGTTKRAERNSAGVNKNDVWNLGRPQGQQPNINGTVKLGLFDSKVISEGNL